jgi:hypothetical protein
MVDTWKKILVTIAYIIIQLFVLVLILFAFISIRTIISDNLIFFWVTLFLVGLLFDFVTRIRKKKLWKNQNVKRLKHKNICIGIYPKNLKGIPISLLDITLLSVQMPIFLAFLSIILVESLTSPFYVPLLIIISSMIFYSFQKDKPLETLKWLTKIIVGAFLFLWIMASIDARELFSPVAILWLMIFLYFLSIMATAFVE